MLVNVSPGNVQLDVLSPDRSYKSMNLNRPGKVVALSLKKGGSIDLIPFFDGSLEDTHKAVMYSRDVLAKLRPNMVHTYVCDDDGSPIDVEKLLGLKTTKKEDKPVLELVEEVVEPVVEDVDKTSPDLGESAVLAAIDQHQAEMEGEANTPTSEKAKTTRKKTSKKK